VVADINAHEANLIARPGHPIREVHEVNARLIAAAPDLLATCEAALATFENFRFADNMLTNRLELAGDIAAIAEQIEEISEALTAAITKAKGE
jgi:hypothetical protein